MFGVLELSTVNNEIRKREKSHKGTYKDVYKNSIKNSHKGTYKDVYKEAIGKKFIRYGIKGFM